MMSFKRWQSSRTYRYIINYFNYDTKHTLYDPICSNMNTTLTYYFSSIKLRNSSKIIPGNAKTEKMQSKLHLNFIREIYFRCRRFRAFTRKVYKCASRARSFKFKVWNIKQIFVRITCFTKECASKSKCYY